MNNIYFYTFNIMRFIKVLNSNILRVVESFDTDRFFYYGIAILLVIFYHALCFGHSFLAFKVFKYGYIGVDIFLFFSGYGLCYSYEKSKLINFYKKRVFRIIPLFVIYASFKSVILSTIGKETLSVWDWFCNLTTLSYYQIGGVFIDWYLCALLLLYIIFPIFRDFAKRTRLIGVITITISCYWILTCFDISWTHQCLIGRLPIFYLGILMYDSTRNNVIDLKSIKALLCLFFLFGIISILTDANKFLITTLISPFLLFFSYFLIDKKVQIVKRILTYLGSKSLEIYLGNCTALTLIRYIEETTMIEYLYYFVITILSSIIYIKLNDVLKNALINTK